MYAQPPKLKCHHDLDLWPRNPKFNRGHLLVMINHHTKLEDSWAMCSQVIVWTSFVYRWPTNRQTDIAKHFEGEHNNPNFLEGFKPIDVRSKWFEVNNPNHESMEDPITEVNEVTGTSTCEHSYLPPNISSACCPILSKSRPETNMKYNIFNNQCLYIFLYLL